jgi:hypothetical protein
MYVVTFEDFTPPPKFDGIPWNSIHIEESIGSSGPWTEIDVQPLSPLDSNPTEPMARAFTTDQATLPNGWYQIIFHDPAASTAVPTVPIQNIPSETMPYLPTLADIGALMRARTVTVMGDEVGTFNEDTRPTGEEVNRLIVQAADDVMAGFDVDIPPGAYRYAKQAIIYRTAMLVELGYWPEQINTGRSPYPQYAAMFDNFMLNLEKAIEREQGELITGEDALSPGMAAYTFPDTSILVGWSTRW